MKKLFTTITAMIFVMSFCVTVAGCGKLDEETFNKAKKNLEKNNYTVQVRRTGMEYSRTLTVERAGENAKVEYIDDSDSETVVCYLREQSGDLQVYFDELGAREWETFEDSTIDEFVFDGGPYIPPMMKVLFFNDFEEKDDKLTLKESASRVLVDYFFYSGDKISEFTVTLKGDKFDSISYIYTSGTGYYARREEYVYQFSKMGGTNVNLPA